MSISKNGSVVILIFNTFSMWLGPEGKNRDEENTCTQF